MKSNWFKGIWVVLLIGFFMQCEVANNTSTQETVNETEQIKQQFNLKLFEDALPQNSSVNWASPNKTYSEKLKSMYVEFPITYDKISASGSGTTKTPPQYSIIAVREASGYKFYLAKFLSNTSISENQNVMLSNADSFTGIAMLLNRDLEAEHVFGLDEGKIKATGSQISKESYKEIKSGKLKMSVDCYTEVVHHYTDWYQEYSDGTVAYIYTEYNGSTETQVCYDDPPTGSGGGGGGSGSTYDEYVGKRLILIDSTFKNNPCLDSVYQQAGQAITFKNILQNFDEEFSVAHLKLSAGVSQTNPGANAVTLAPKDYIIEIMFNPNKLNRSKLEIARTLIHELIHAEMWRKVMSLLDNGANLDGLKKSEWTQKLSNGDYPGIFDYYTRFGVNGFQHESMAAHYRGIIENAIKEFDSSLNNQTYEALAWVGLTNTRSWTTNLTQAQRTYYTNALTNYRNNASTNCN
jgi:hypothetical protein